VGDFPGARFREFIPAFANRFSVAARGGDASDGATAGRALRPGGTIQPIQSESRKP
jgi:hypothetical protein